MGWDQLKNHLLGLGPLDALVQIDVVVREAENLSRFPRVVIGKFVSPFVYIYAEPVGPGRCKEGNPTSYRLFEVMFFSDANRAFTSKFLAQIKINWDR